MGWLLSGGIILFLLLLIFILLLWLRVYLTLDYQYENGSDYFHIQVEILGVRVFHKEFFPFSEGENRYQSAGISEKEEGKSLKQKWQEWMRHLEAYRSILPLIFEFISQISVHQLSWKTKIGLTDARATGIAAGAGWGIKYSLVAWLHSHAKRMPREEIDILPLFQHEYLYTKAECIFSFRLGKAIRIIRHIMKQFSSKTWKTANEPVNT
ncbi:DUF2953 domain-containing protein [Sediminibacillus dalangtanensis]|uniref:DUF2953 domain-containing protein n=1 Tax=Sediminibacillus dalangtanensis TaxID=2729421 RepID=A0ABX7VWV2_9BACI|nr:DUF2953 domain-containing protein [Sediminibacillus dalangtanensis]QTN00086.1 DUF2953 domain-containing protein [Sediminibacillus dalangtanensis]